MGRLILKPYQPRQRFIPKNVRHEDSLQLQACNYIRYIAPRTIFRSDFASGMLMSPNQARKHRSLQSSRAFPDLFIFEPREVTYKDGTTKLYYGMAIELKREGTTIVVSQGARKGHITSDLHIQEQYLMLKDLAKKGYYTNFAVGIDEFIKIANWYFGIPDNASLF